MGLRRLVLNMFLLMAISPMANALTCPDAGYFEKLIEPEKTQDGFVRVTRYHFGSSETIVRPAKYKIMTREKYNALDKDMTYGAYSYEPSKISKKIIKPVTNIANYDLVLTLDGNSFYRPLEEQVNKRAIETHEIEKPSTHKRIVKSEKRPEPEVLPDGQLKVMISPEYYVNLSDSGQRSEFWSHYIKSRTPATYQQVKCNEDK